MRGVKKLLQVGHQKRNRQCSLTIQIQWDKLGGAIIDNMCKKIHSPYSKVNQSGNINLHTQFLLLESALFTFFYVYFYILLYQTESYHIKAMGSNHCICRTYYLYRRQYVTVINM